ncbi:MAG: hypothetical protein R3321_11580 [Nitrososphaeraceae archaeon]|nr:hypothetical protein [Nitrososphaeraceae archaeon]
MTTRDKLKRELIELAETTLETSKQSLEALKALIPEAPMKDLNTLYNNSLKNHKVVLSQILMIEKEEREERINREMEKDAPEVDFSKYDLET